VDSNLFIYNILLKKVILVFAFLNTRLSDIFILDVFTKGRFHFSAEFFSSSAELQGQ